MNDAVIDSINDAVGPNDTLYMLGDFAFGNSREIPSLRSRIKCNNIALIYGNHDKAIRQSMDYRNLFVSCKDYDEIHIADADGGSHGLVLFHYYIGGVWNNAGKPGSRGYYHLFGHSHGSLLDSYLHGKCFDIGWDVWQRPLSEYEVCIEMDKRPEFGPIDHHGVQV